MRSGLASEHWYFKYVVRLLFSLSLLLRVQRCCTRAFLSVSVIGISDMLYTCFSLCLCYWEFKYVVHLLFSLCLCYWEFKYVVRLLFSLSLSLSLCLSVSLSSFFFFLTTRQYLMSTLNCDRSQCEEERCLSEQTWTYVIIHTRAVLLIRHQSFIMTKNLWAAHFCVSMNLLLLLSLPSSLLPQ